MDETQYKKQKQVAEKIFKENPKVRCPYFDNFVTLNSDGFHHLQFSSRRERPKKEQILKFTLLPLALGVIKKSGTIQEYRKALISVGSPEKKTGLSLTKTVQYWAFEAVVGNNNHLKVKVVIRRVGDGNIVFWSVMPGVKLNGDQLDVINRLATNGIEDD